MLYIVACLLKARVVKGVETAISRERLCKDIVPAATMEELLVAVFTVWSVLRLYKESALSR
jgi:hypothetical protein